MRRFLSMGNCNSRNRDGGASPTNSPSKKVHTGQDNILSISASFKFHDLKGDGVIDREELLSYFKSDKTVAAIIERLDKNKDGVISYAEFYNEVSKIKDGEATLQTYLQKFPLVIEAVITPKEPSRLLPLQNKEVPMTWAAHLDDTQIDKVLKFGPFVDWMQSINQIENTDRSKPELIVDKVHIQHIDMFGPRIGFIKFEVAARKWNEKMKQIAFVPGIVFMRGGAVGILCILIEAETGREFSLITLQPRIPVGSADFAEIPAGMLDGEPNHQKFAGKAAKEMSEETLLEIQDTELYDLTQLAYSNKHKGMYPSAGGCDEFLRLFLYRRYMSKDVMDLLKIAHAGDGESEIIKLKLVPLEDLWREAPDAKALSALYLYTKFQELKINHPPTKINPDQEEALKALLKPKVEHHLQEANGANGRFSLKGKEAEGQIEKDKEERKEESREEEKGHNGVHENGSGAHDNGAEISLPAVIEEGEKAEGEEAASEDVSAPLIESR